MPNSYKLFYFNGRGRAEIIRLCFVAKDVKYEDNRLNGEEWAAFKPKTPFGQMPFLQVNGKDLAQTSAIVRYVAKEEGLVPSDSFQLAECDMITEGVGEVATKMMEMFFCKDEKKKAELKTEYFGTTLPARLAIFEKLLSSNKGGDGYFVGDKLTYADLAFFDFANRFAQGKIEVPEQLKPYPKLLALYNRVMSTPNIHKWLETRPQTEM